MSPILRISRDTDPNIADHHAIPKSDQGLIIESWAQGYLVGSLVIMIFITLANMRRGVLLHKVRFSLPGIKLVADPRLVNSYRGTASFHSAQLDSLNSD